MEDLLLGTKNVKAKCLQITFHKTFILAAYHLHSNDIGLIFDNFLNLH